VREGGEMRQLLHGVPLLLLLLAAVAHAQQTARTDPGDGEHVRFRLS
jgi:hypothetical protein